MVQILYQKFRYSIGMKKTLIIFIVLTLVLIAAKMAYNKYCESQPDGCKKEKYDKDAGLPQEGIDY